MTNEQIIQRAQQTIREEIEAIQYLPDFVDEDFAQCVKAIYDATGRVVVTGIGKSANIGQKIVATFNSTGTPAMFMHAADAIHGDLGMIQKDDVIICISRSGNTPEIKMLVPLLKTYGNKLIAMVSDITSYLAKQADFIINCHIEKEAGLFNLAPTSSTTAQLVMGDALAMALVEYRHFTPNDFARNHPGGVLGKRLYLTVEELYPHNAKPEVSPAANIRDVIIEISSKRLGSTAVTENGKLLGIITDGDLRRMLQKNLNIETVTAIDVMSPNPRTIDCKTLVVDALSIMRNHSITQLLVVENEQYVGVIHLHDILKEGIM
ncbi:MAG: KpsF/GutQ family sugar-phosphate isomerase [Bacteroidales bacterium]|nr:KpsF/GutQ family sugar-phosphate isomerase [Bacteroidales bacterium]